MRLDQQYTGCILVTAKAARQTDSLQPIWGRGISSQHNDKGQSMYIMNTPASWISKWVIFITMPYHFIPRVNKYYLKK